MTLSITRLRAQGSKASVEDQKGHHSDSCPLEKATLQGFMIASGGARGHRLWISGFETWKVFPTRGLWIFV